MAHPIRRGGSDRARRGLTLPFTPPENFDACQILHVQKEIFHEHPSNWALTGLLGQPY